MVQKPSPICQQLNLPPCPPLQLLGGRCAVPMWVAMMFHRLALGTTWRRDWHDDSHIRNAHSRIRCFKCSLARKISWFRVIFGLALQRQSCSPVICDLSCFDDLFSVPLYMFRDRGACIPDAACVLQMTTVHHTFSSSSTSHSHEY